MTSHGIARTSRTRTEAQRVQELEKITKYRELESQIRARVADNDWSLSLLPLTTKILKLNPEYQTIWNVRRRLLISGSLSKSSAGLQPSTGWPSSSQTATTTPSPAVSSCSSSTAIPPNQESQTIGRSGTTAESANGEEHSLLRDDSGGAAPSRTVASDQDLDILRSELSFTVPLLIESPKCYWIWNYRSWLLQEAIERLDTSTARRIWTEELVLTSKMLTKDRRNFHAWTYRRRVVAQLESPELDGESMVETEFEYTRRMILVDLSNFSAWHNRSKLIPRLLDERNAGDAARQALLDEELALIHNALNVGPEDQSLWYYHQFLMLSLTESDSHEIIAPDLATDVRVVYLAQEIEFAKDLLDDYKDIKWIYQVLLEFTLSLARLEKRSLHAGEVKDLQHWLARLRALDPMRTGRWNDVEKECGHN